MYKENLIKYLQEAQNSIKNNNFKNAITIYNGILAEIPGQPDAYYGFYKIYMIKNDIKKAKKGCQALKVLVLS